MQENQAIENDIRVFLSSHFPLFKEGQVGREESLVESGVIDSLGILELVDFVETKFDLRIPEHELVPENLDSIANITRYLTERLGGEDVVQNAVGSS
jgi:acyl carrier protein